MIRINFLFLVLGLTTLYSEEKGKTPQEALNLLMQGNEQHPNLSEEKRLETFARQTPFAVVVSCSDSRVSPEIIFDQGLGDLFVVRVAGNVIGPIELESIEYAVEQLHTPLILVLGHEKCAAVQAVLKNQTKGLESIASLIKPAVKEAQKQNKKNLLEQTIKQNVQNMVAELRKNSVLKKHLEDKSLEIKGGYYSLFSGDVKLL